MRESRKALDGSQGRMLTCQVNCHWSIVFQPTHLDAAVLFHTIQIELLVWVLLQIIEAILQHACDG